YQRMWDCMQEELQLLLTELLQAGALAGGELGRPARPGGRGGTDPRVAGGGPGGGGFGSGVRSLLADLNPVHFLEQLAALAERTADLAENALGGGGGGGASAAAGARPPAPNKPQLQFQQPPQPPQVPGGGPDPQGTPRRRHEAVAGSKLTFAFDLPLQLPGPEGGGGGDQVWGGAVVPRGPAKEAAGYAPLLHRLIGEGCCCLQLLPDTYLPALRLVTRAEQLLRLPPDLAPTSTSTTSPFASSSSPSSESGGPPVVSSWLPAYLEQVALEQLLPQLWVELRGRCTAALEDPD
ncbi:hypothetical protein Agub_g8123, partial [Astrephomene gubernaculifera]